VGTSPHAVPIISAIVTAAAVAHDQSLVMYEAASVKALVLFDAGEPGPCGFARREMPDTNLSS
jgi:hypothetical protein